MTKVSTPIGTTSSLAFPSNIGMSDDAQVIEREYIEMLRELVHTQSVASIYRQTTKIFANAIEEYYIDNWDGYGAKAVDELSWNKAVRFSQLLPTNVPMPEIYLDTDGEATFEWYTAPRNVFSVTVRGNGELAYAGIFGRSKTHGTEYLDDEIPEEILNKIYTVVAGGVYLAAA
jgi:hypothetical protein